MSECFQRAATARAVLGAALLSVSPLRVGHPLLTRHGDYCSTRALTFLHNSSLLLTPTLSLSLHLSRTHARMCNLCTDTRQLLRRPPPLLSTFFHSAVLPESIKAVYSEIIKAATLLLHPTSQQWTATCRLR